MSKSSTGAKSLPVLLPVLFDTRGGATPIARGEMAGAKADTYGNRTRYANDWERGKQPGEAKGQPGEKRRSKEQAARPTAITNPG